MKGKTNQQIREEREKLVKELEFGGHIVIDTVLDITENKSPIYYLSKSKFTLIIITKNCLIILCH